VLKGTIRTFSDAVRALVGNRVRELAKGIAAAYGASIDVVIDERFTVLENSAAQAGVVADIARELLGPDSVNPASTPQMGSEDFADMLKARPGAYFFVAQGDGPALHNPSFNFNDEILPIGAAMLARIAEVRAGA
jgi:hippurate hydrolase